MTATSSDTGPPRARGTALRAGSLGVGAIVFFVLSAQSPLTGIAGALPIAISIGSGAGAPAAFLIVGLVMALFAAGFIAMSRQTSGGGAFYSYIGHGIGRHAGTGAAFTALLSYCAIQAGMYGLYGVTVSSLLDHYLGVSAPWWACSVVTMLLVMAWAWLNIEVGAKLLACLVAVEMAILAAFAVVVLARGGGPEGFGLAATFEPHAVFAGAPGVAFTFAVASMFGFESTALYSAEARDPRRTIPRATYLAVAIVAGFFAFVSWTVVSYYGPSHVTAAAGKAMAGGDATTLLGSAVSDTLGAWASTALGIVLATSLLAGILAFHNAINRYLHSLAGHGRLPGRVGWTNRHGSPYLAGTLSTLVSAALVVPFALAGQDPVLTLFSWFGGVAVAALLLLYLLTTVSVVVYFRRRPAPDESALSTLVCPVLAGVLILAGIYVVVDNFGTLTGGAPRTAALLLAGVVVAFLAGVLVEQIQGTRPGRHAAAPAPTPETSGSL
ncbi:APC family permease [Streptomyces sp. NPDC058045]|uniref:APC family permease n=1 Tax=Streptomyces sp. NPDC058045 TaxID=3346311 RepID=UPI0036E08D86